MSTLSLEARAKLAAYLRFQQAMGVETVAMKPPRAQERAQEPPPGRLRPAAAAASETASAGPKQIELAKIETDLGKDCTRCKLHRGRKQVVFGSGNPEARIVFVGEGPGADEDAQGLPFVGRGGQLLTDMIQKGMGLRREEVYICNVVKCRPPGNRTPEADECAACTPFLYRQIAAVRPEVVCALGATAAQALRPYKGSLISVRGQVHAIEVNGHATQLVVTYHPAYLLRDPSQKKEAWKDLQIAMGLLGLG